MRNGQIGSWGGKESCGLEGACKTVLWSLDFYLGNIEVSLRVLRRKETWSNLVLRKVTVGAVGRMDKKQTRPGQRDKTGGGCRNSSSVDVMVV